HGTDIGSGAVDHLGDPFVGAGEGDVADGGDTAGRRGAGATGEVVRPAGLPVGEIDARQVGVAVDPAREDGPVRGLDFRLGGHRAADLYDAAVTDPDVGVVVTRRGHQRSPSNRQVDELSVGHLRFPPLVRGSWRVDAAHPRYPQRIAARSPWSAVGGATRAAYGLRLSGIAANGWGFGAVLAA